MGAREADAGRERAQLLGDSLRRAGRSARRGSPGGRGSRRSAGHGGLKAALERLAQGGELGAQLALGQIGEHLRVGRAGHERVEHRAPGGAQDVGGDAVVELDAGVLQRLVQPVGLALALGDLGLAIARCWSGWRTGWG